MSRRNSYEAKQARKLNRQAEVARREAARKGAQEMLEETLTKQVSKIITEYNETLAKSSLDALKESARRRRQTGDDRITGAISKMRKSDLIEMLTLGERDVHEYVAKNGASDVD